MAFATLFCVAILGGSAFQEPKTNLEKLEEEFEQLANEEQQRRKV